MNEHTKKRVRQLYQFLREANQLKFRPVRQLSEQPKVVNLSDIPKHPALQISRPIRGSNGLEIPEKLISIRRPIVTRCPHPSEVLNEWLLPGWDDPFKPGLCTDSINAVNENDETITIRFDADEKRIEAFELWNSLRDAWAPPERLARQAMRFFEIFYDIHSMLEKEGEQLELLVADGHLVWRAISGIDGPIVINHPILLKRVELCFDPTVPEFTVQETDRESEIYGALFVDLKDVAPSALRNRQNELTSSGYHPLGWEDTDAFLKAFIQTISPINGEFIDKPEGGTTETPRLWRNPVLLLRKRVAGIANAIDSIIDDIDKQDCFPPALEQITGTIDSWENQDFGIGNNSNIDKETNFSPVSYDDMLLAKEANEEQLQIIRRLNQSGSVIVQGPPGTGKTHTIGNLVGHLLAQGKSILVTSHTTKALRVLRDKVPDALQPLCVAVLGSDKDARHQLESSISSITERLTMETSSTLTEKAEQYSKKRKELLLKNCELQNLLRQGLENEYKEIIIDNQSTTPSEAARYVASHQSQQDWIPSPVKLGATLTLTEQELIRLYELNTLFTVKEEADAELPLLSLSNVPSERQFQVMVSEYEDLLTRDLSVGQSYWQATSNDSVPVSEIGEILSGEFSSELRRLAWRPYAIVAGIHGGTEREVWERLISKIEVACEANSKLSMVIHHRPELSKEIPIVRQRQIALDICDYLDSGSTLGFLQLVTRAEWRQFIKSASVSAGQPKHREHFVALSCAARLAGSRLELEDLWNLLIGQRTNTPLSSLGPTPELSCRALITEIKRCLNWHATVWVPLAERMKGQGLKLDDLSATLPREANQISEYLIIEHLATSLLPSLLEAEACRRKLKECEIKFDCLIHYAKSEQPSSGGCVGMLVAAVSTRDAAAYSHALEYSRRLHTVKPLTTERKALLQKLEHVAPAWAKCIEMRTPPHNSEKIIGESGPAWRWRQMHDTLVERDNLVPQELQRQIDATREALQKITPLLIDAKAWGIQLERLKKNNSIRQALVGWLDTAKRLISTRQIEKRQSLLSESRRLMKQCAKAVPVWIMPISLMAESFDPRTTKFDVVIIDEASQADLNALIPLYMGAQIVIVGDHEQVTPLGVGKDQTILENLRKSILQDIPNAHLFDNLSSIYDIGRQSFGDAIRLVEHFRCVPEIIAFSNQLSYEGKIRPLRESNSTNLKPACIPYYVSGIRDGDINTAEAEAIVSLIKAMIKHPAYIGKSIGVMSMVGESQAITIESMLHKHIDGVELEKRRIQAGIPAQFQGDERDVIFLSLVDSPEAEGPLRAVGEGAYEQTKKRYNVATSRAKDQLWVVHSFDPELHLKANDIRLRLMRHVKDPMAIVRAYHAAAVKTESNFEQLVLKRLIEAGYRVKPQWQVGYYRIDLVVEGGGKRLAIECDGDRWHPLEKLAEDMSRQAVLERLGWHFVRIRGSAFYRNPDAAMKHVFNRLMEMGILPEGQGEEEHLIDWTLIHQLDEIVQQTTALDEVSQATQESEEQERPIDQVLGGNTINLDAIQTDFMSLRCADDLVKQLLNELGGNVPMKIFLRHYAKARGYQRIGKKIRLELELNLKELERMGIITVNGNIISFSGVEN